MFVLVNLNFLIKNFLLDEHGHHEHESYFGDQDTESLVQTMETLVASVSLESKRLALEDKSDKTKDPKRHAPSAGGCRVEGFVRVKKVGITPI
ncbi:unnamed protein product [Coffea canephora]|uniref:Uncharacterized protein n=1 Tax=Coffea canephora TaxID=49390 RepID=A0A068TYZ3_COFCA|nr:unnamed protein product [Coffea canephora]CDP04876.1 unnamed protein product [Coffea canephora]